MTDIDQLIEEIRELITLSPKQYTLLQDDASSLSHLK